MIWCCWIVWGKRWLIILLPVLFLVSALVSLILCMAFEAYDSVLSNYFDALATISKEIAPTLLVGYVAAGHAHPDDSWQGSVISGSLHFGTHSGSQNSQQDSMMSSDLEAQVDQPDMDNDYTHHTVVVESQNGLANEGSVHEDDPEALEDGGVNSKNVVHGDDLEDQLNRPEDHLTEPAVLAAVLENASRGAKFAGEQCGVWSSTITGQWWLEHHWPASNSFSGMDGSSPSEYITQCKDPALRNQHPALEVDTIDAMANMRYWPRILEKSHQGYYAARIVRIVLRLGDPRDKSLPMTVIPSMEKISIMAATQSDARGEE
ncbi:hypothetical protein IW262DRAFT_1291079 [Armillaria fumosa]|nr:hypothetical protein IW262DRAFT_1291079 [Armillaria fumosa]